MEPKDLSPEATGLGKVAARVSILAVQDPKPSHRHQVDGLNLMWEKQRMLTIDQSLVAT